MLKDSLEKSVHKSKREVLCYAFGSKFLGFFPSEPSTGGFPSLARFRLVLNSLRPFCGLQKEREREAYNESRRKAENFEKLLKAYRNFFYFFLPRVLLISHPVFRFVHCATLKQHADGYRLWQPERV